MFQEWGFLLTEIGALLAAAALIGLIAGWIIWGGRRAPGQASPDKRDELEAARARAVAAEEELAELRRLPAPGGIANPEAMARLRDQLDACHDARSIAEARIAELEEHLADSHSDHAPETQSEPQSELQAERQADTVVDSLLDPDTLPRDAEGYVSVGRRPEGLRDPRGGVPDDLKLIRGVGPKLEELNNRLGYWHYDQIANWTEEEVAWVDHNLGAFNGRVTRDDWVGQAKALSRGEQA